MGSKGTANEVNIWWFALLIIFLYSPLAVVRKLQRFSFGYILGNIMILFTIIVVSVYCIRFLVRDGPKDNGVNFKTVNSAKMWDMVGFSFYSFEGIGIVMPIMENSKNHNNYPKILTAALLTLGVMFCSFGFLCYYYFGKMDAKFVTQNFDQNDNFLKVTELLFCVNLVFSYPLTVYPTNKIIE